MTAPALKGQQATRNLRLVRMVNGQTTTVMTDAEAQYYEDSRDLYLQQTKFTENTDLKDLDRLLVLELMTFRWQQHLFAGLDYDGDMVNEKQLSADIKLYCVDEQTEILTQHGWATYDQVVPGEEVYTFNTATGLAEWQVPTVMHFGEGHKMLRLVSRQHDSLTTPGHSWPVWQGNGRYRQAAWRTSEELNTASRLMLAVDPTPRVKVEDDAYVELAGWFWTEGSLTSIRGRPAQGTVVQSFRVNPEHCERISTCLEAVYGTPGPMGSVRGSRRAPYWNVTGEGDSCLIWHLSVQVVEDLQRAVVGAEKVLSADWLRSLTRDQLRLLIDVSVMADGWVTSKGSVRLCQKSEARIRAFEMACALGGVATTTKPRSVGDFEVGLLSCRDTAPLQAASQGKGAVAEYVDYEGVFWCPTTPNQTWLARRNGTVYWTGNSDQINKIKETMGLSKKSREDSLADGNFSAWLTDLKARAKLFGVHREGQLTKALVLMKELFTVVNSFDRSDAEERRKLGFETEAEILDWIRQVMQPEFNALDEYFRAHSQRYWIREQ